MVETLSCGLRDPGSIPGRGRFFSPQKLFYFSQKPLACKVLLDDPLIWEDITLGFLYKQFSFPYFERMDLSNAWPYGRIFETTSGYHGEFSTPEDPDVSLFYLGKNETEAVNMMQRLIAQHMYIESLK